VAEFVGEVLPLLCLHGLSTGDFVLTLEGFFGSPAGPSASVVNRRLTAAWQAGRAACLYGTRPPGTDDV
jgi:hypothetical protein